MMNPTRTRARTTPEAMSALTGLTLGIGTRLDTAPIALPTVESADDAALFAALVLTGVVLEAGATGAFTAGILAGGFERPPMGDFAFNAGFAAGLPLTARLFIGWTFEEGIPAGFAAGRTFAAGRDAPPGDTARVEGVEGFTVAAERVGAAPFPAAEARR